MRDKVYFRLTEYQRRCLAPLFNQVHEAFMKGERGMILGQLKEESFYATFIPHEYAERIREIIKEMEEKSP